MDRRLYDGSLLIDCAILVLGRERQAMVTGHQFVPVKHGTNYRITYTYTESGSQYTESDTFENADAFIRHKTGSTIPVISLHAFGHGGSLALTTDTPAESLGGRAAMLVFLDGFIIVLFWVLCFSPLAERRLLRDGVPVIGQITGKTIRRGKSTSYVLSYTYSDHHNRPHVHETAVRKSEYEGAATGEPELVFYDPESPGRSAVYRYCQYAVRDRHGGEILG